MPDLASITEAWPRYLDDISPDLANRLQLSELQCQLRELTIQLVYKRASMREDR